MAPGHAIVGGTDAGIDEYNSIGAVVFPGLGSFVALSPSFLLTAAHVVDVFDPSHPEYVEGAVPFLYAGHADSVLPVLGGELVFLAEDVILHPDYVIGEFEHDLAIINVQDGLFGLLDPSTQDVSFATLR